MGMYCCPFICEYTRFAVVPYKYIVKRELMVKLKLKGKDRHLQSLTMKAGK